MVKIDIISGFLGAGKTTFIKKLLQEGFKGEKVVLIENEFGQVGIDSGFLKEAGIEIREMNSGCICCSLVGDFETSLKEVLKKYQPERVLIEPSGVGKLSDVMKAIEEVESNCQVCVNAAVTLVDVTKCKMYMKNFGEFFNNQIEHAKVVLLSRTDLADQSRVEEVVSLLRGMNQTCKIITTPLSQLSGEQIVELMESSTNMEASLLEEVKGHHHHGHGEGGGRGGHHGAHGHDGHHEGGCCGGHGGGCCGGHHHDHHHGHDHNHGEGCGCEGHHEGHDHHHAEEVFSSFGCEAICSMTRASLEVILDEMAYGNQYGEVLRAKGMIPQRDSDVWLHFDLVPEQLEIRDGKPDYTSKICVIGVNLNEEKLKQAFDKE